jgi:RimJ/RimL family protein N-acetyltransferase
MTTRTAFLSAPVLETERLRMRPHSADDFDDLITMWSDERVTRHIGGRVSTGQETWARLLRYAGLWPLLGFGYWAVEERATGRFVGDVGFADFRREITPPLRAPEAGWVLAPWAHGRGFATEALRAALAWADAHLQSASTVCIIDIGHAVSIRVATKCGYVESGRTTYMGDAIAIFERPRAGAPAARDS